MLVWEGLLLLLAVDDVCCRGKEKISFIIYFLYIMMKTKMSILIF